jgi:diaminohydroxyphosphoribosylaminopyrimidine deaminase/5-amino-6-(5-phosphoribosylamino)uracil reductase
VSAALCAVDCIGVAVHPRSLETGHRMTTGETTMADATAMRRALELATRGPARGVNPRVGCVILSPDGEVLAEGWHRGAGTAHAEVDALSHLAPGAAEGATAVVTLEPCNHTGRTGPCAVALIDAGVSRVVYAVADPGDHSAGGAERLRAAGVDVTGGVLADEVNAFLDDWLFAARHRRPRVVVKWASSLDGRAAAADGTSQWITGPEARADVHRRRSAAEAIAVGTGTVLADDPALTARDPGGQFFDAQPVPVVFGRRAVPSDAAVTRHPHAPMFFEGVDLASDLAELAHRGIRSLFVEGGPTLASAFITAGFADELLVYVAPTLLGGPRLALGDLGVASIDAALRYEFAVIERLGDDVLLVAHPISSPASRDSDPAQERN